MEYLISIAEIQPSFFKGSLDLVVDAMLFVAKAETLEISTRSIALELIVTITETSPSLARKCSKLLDGLVPIAFSLMLELDEDESDWINGKYTEESVDDNYIIGEEAIERVCTSLGGKLVGPFIFKYVQSFIVMNDYKYRRAAIAGLTRFAEGSVDSSSIEVKIPTIVLLGCIAQCSKSSFAAYYPSLINGIKSILYTNVNSYNHLAIGNDVNTYQGKAIECVGLMTEAVGSEIFFNDANEIMQFIIHVLTTNQDNDLIFDYYLPATARISKIYSTNFCNYLPIIMKLILQVANQKIDITMTDADDDDVEGEITVDEDTGNESTVIKLGLGVKKRVTMNTHAVQQKLQATRLLVEFANNLKSVLFAAGRVLIAAFPITEGSCISGLCIASYSDSSWSSSQKLQFVYYKLCLAVKDVPDAVNESKFIAIAITFILMLSVLVFPIVFLLGLEPVIYQIIATVSFGVAAIVTVNAIFLPKAISILSSKENHINLKHKKKHKLVVPVNDATNEGQGQTSLTHTSSIPVNLSSAFTTNNNVAVNQENLLEVTKAIILKMKPDDRTRYCYENISNMQAMLLNTNSNMSQGSSHVSSMIDNVEPLSNTL
eukprot:gene19616-25525_t